jgi:D-alanyl-D-alanine dipeptidase
MRREESAYWLQALGEAHTFMADAAQRAVVECHDPVVSIEAGAQSAGVRLVCLATPHPSGRPRDHRIRQANLEPLLAAAASFADRGLTLVIEDALRSTATQAQTATSPAVVHTLAGLLASADRDVGDQEIIDGLGAMVAATPATAGHVAGAAVDIAVRDAEGRELDRGGPYLDLSARMPMASPYVTDDQRAVRAFITGVMSAHGFVAYPHEFWHYSRGDALAATAIGDPAPAVFGPVHVQPDGRVESIDEPHRPLNPPQVQVAAIRRAIEELRRIEPGSRG